MYTLKVLEKLELPDGRLFLPDHDAKSLNAFEVSELVTEYPGVFEPADDVTRDFLANGENVAHLANAVKQQRVSGNVAASGNVAKVKK
jgi:hypothetical protein